MKYFSWRFQIALGLLAALTFLVARADRKPAVTWIEIVCSSSAHCLSEEDGAVILVPKTNSSMENKDAVLPVEIPGFHCGPSLGIYGAYSCKPNEQH